MGRPRKNKNKEEPKKEEAVIEEIEKIENTEIKYTNLEGRLIHIKVGNDVRPATQEDIDDAETKITEILEKAGLGDKCIVFVSHHAMEIRPI